MTHSDFLFELGCEDLPARLLKPLQDALAGGVAAGLAQAGLAHGAIEAFATPRRLAVLVHDLPGQQPDQQVERRGPAVAAAFKDGQPTGAARGFAKSCGVSMEELQQEDTDKGPYLVYRAVAPGRSVDELIPGVLQSALRGMDELVPKRMRWGDGTDTFVRPVQWLVAMHGERPIPLKLFGLVSGSVTRGHRFHAPAPISLKAAGDYELALARANVIAAFSARRDRIRVLIEQWEGASGLKASVSDELLDEVSALIEWPVLVAGEFDEAFLELPPEVIVTTIEGHQRYFPVFSADGKIQNRFLTVSNIESREPHHVVTGNERVVRPRLADANFFWDQDLRVSVDKRQAQLAHVSYQQGLGSVEDRAVRIGDIAREVAAAQQLDTGAAAHAGALCKNDLVSSMVFEFPELQGIMGGYYLARAGEADAVAQAVAHHYQPAGPDEPIPPTDLGCVVAAADKLDALGGTFALGNRPTASKDPFGMRRAANGLLRILIERRWALDVHTLLEFAVRVQPVVAEAAALSDLKAFVDERFASMLYERFGFSANVIQAVRNRGFAIPVDALERIEALAAFSGTSTAEALGAAHKRANNILAKAGDIGLQAPDPGAFVEDAEGALWEELQTVSAAIQGCNYAETLERLARLRDPVDCYFDNVMINVDDPALQRNRLATLAALVARLEQVADLSVL